jgi:hypothetical protein
MLYTLPTKFLIENKLISKEKYNEIKKSLLIETKKEDKADIHIDAKLETPKLYYTEKYTEQK